MARIAGIDLPKSKKIAFALRYIYGVGPSRSNAILSAVHVDGNVRVKDLTEADVSKISSEISRTYRVEGDLRREVQQNVRRLIDIGSYRGMRHRRNLPVHGQRTRSNARTRRGRRRTIGSGPGAPAKTT